MPRIRWGAVGLIAGFACTCLASATHAQAPWDYYARAHGLHGDELRTTLHEIIDDHHFFPYSSSATDAQDILRDADEAPSDPDSVLTVYANSLLPKVSDPTAWSREHLWPKSYGFPDRGSCNYPDSDTHALFASGEHNGQRGVLPFGWCTDGGQCGEFAVEGHSGTPNLRGMGVWQVWPGRRGNVARALLYLDVRYDGSDHTETACDEPDLILTDDRSLIQNSNRVNVELAHMGILSTLLQWHLEDPVDAKEQRRNEIIYSYQRNRNPFIDHPEWVCDIWVCPRQLFLPVLRKSWLPVAPTAVLRPTTTIPPATSTPVPSTAPVSPTPPSPTGSARINQLLCGGRDEIIEISGTGGAATNLAGWTIVSVVGDQRFTLPIFQLAPGSTVSIHSGPDAPETSGNHIRWTRSYIWNNDGDFAELLTPSGTVVDTRDCDSSVQ